MPVEPLEQAIKAARAEALPKLTDVEVKIVRLILTGKTTKEIALIFHSTPKAVQHRVNRISAKFRVNGRDLIVAYAICNQLISLEEARALITKRPPDPEPY